jgi:hypothetical protein
MKNDQIMNPQGNVNHNHSEIVMFHFNSNRTAIIIMKKITNIPKGAEKGEFLYTFLGNTN